MKILTEAKVSPITHRIPDTILKTRLNMAQSAILQDSSYDNRLLQLWDAVKETGKELLLQRYIQRMKLSQPEAEILQKWEEFICKMYSECEEVLDDLGIQPPDAIRIEYFGSQEGATASLQEVEGRRILRFYATKLMDHFFKYCGAKKDHNHISAWYDLKQVLAHELRHLHDFMEFPEMMNREDEQQLPTNKRRSEYVAHLYALRS